MSLDVMSIEPVIRAHMGLAAEERLRSWPLAAGPGRAVRAYAAGRGAELVAKLYPDDTGAQAFAALNALAGGMAGRAPEALALPRALFYVPEARLLGLSYVRGAPLSELARGLWAEGALRTAGQAVAELHSLRVAAGPPRRLREHLADLVRPQPAELAAYDGRLAALAERLLCELLAAEATIDLAAVAAPIHRDLHLRQLFLGAGRIWLVDWDLFACGDPALDVGNMEAYLHTHLGGRAASAAAAFRAGYAAGGGGPAMARAPLYVAFTYLRLACKRARLQAPDWREEAAALLDSGRRELAAWAEPGFPGGAL